MYEQQIGGGGGGAGAKSDGMDGCWNWYRGQELQAIQYTDTKIAMIIIADVRIRYKKKMHRTMFTDWMKSA